MGQAIAMTPKALRDEFYKKNKKTFVKVDGQNIESDIWSDHEVMCVHTRRGRLLNTTKLRARHGGVA